MVASDVNSALLIDIAKTARTAASQLALLSTEARNQSLEAIASALENSASEIIAANNADCIAASAQNISKSLYARLQLSEKKLAEAIQGVRQVAALSDPLGITQIHRSLDDGLILKRITCPLGVLGIIFEARPDALIQITSLGIKSGNGVILKGGKEASLTCQTLVKVIHSALSSTQVNPTCIQLLTTREEIQALLALDEYVDLIIPRGSNSFVRYVLENTKIPVLGHADGICHLYIDKQADKQKAIAITQDSKIQYPAACNAIETLLIHEEIASVLLPEIAANLESKQVQLLGCEKTRKIINVGEATAADWSTEYSDLILSIKIVESIEAAIAHINTYSSKHTEAIVTEDNQAASMFLNQVDAAGVFHNCSTRFADGFRYGFGAEVGISTQKMPPRGPVGLEGLVTYKYQLIGNGHIVASYTGTNAKAFTHRDI